jgi:hypothetical protein
VATRDHVDADFNAASREVDCKLEVFFDEEPVTITSHDYLVKLTITEEGSAEDTHPLGVVSANELTVSLLNANKLFSPDNTLSTYYGKIKTGVKLIPYIRLIDSVDTLNWIQLGVFYVSKWQASITGTTASIYAMDSMKAVLSEAISKLQVVAGYSYTAFYEYLFSRLGVSATVDQTLTDTIPFACVYDSIGTSISEVSCAAKALCFIDRSGVASVVSLTTARSLRATLTDSDQIIDVTATQTTVKAYDGVAFTYQYPQLTANTELLNTEGFEVATGTNTYSNLSFSKGPVAAISSVSFQTEAATVSVDSFGYSPWLLDITCANTSGSTLSTNLVVSGTSVDFTSITLADGTANDFKYTNRYIQTADLAASYKVFLNAYVDSDMPTLEVNIRGNLLLKIGDKLTINSAKYNITFTGLILRATHTYVGSLSTTLVLLNSSILEA